jgi:alpha-ketoglutarate-dependent taurine dioxygenase
MFDHFELPHRVGSLVVTNGTLNELDAQTALNELQHSPVVIYRGLRGEQHDLVDLATRMGGVQKKVGPFLSGNLVRTVAMAKGEISPSISLHNEMSFTPWAPSLLMFRCRHASGPGGETLFADGAALLESLGDSVRTVFDTQPIEHSGYFPAQIAAGTFGTPAAAVQILSSNGLDTTLDAEGGVHTTFRTSAIPTSPFSRRRAFANSVLCHFDEPRDEVRGMFSSALTFVGGAPLAPALLQKIRMTADVLTYAHRWEAGDLAILDNLRAMHGRRSVRSCDRYLEVVEAHLPLAS